MIKVRLTVTHLVCSKHQQNLNNLFTNSKELVLFDTLRLLNRTSEKVGLCVGYGKV